MKLHCPACARLVPAANIHFETGWGKCAECQELFRLAAVLPDYSAPAAQALIRPVRPYDARAHVERSATELLVHVPAEGMRASTWALLGFGTFWTGFTAFWTTGALGLWGNQPPQAFNFAFASFSIPFWIVGFGMLGGVVWKARCTRTVRLDAEGMVAGRRCSWWSRTRHTPIEDLQHARVYAPAVRSEQHPQLAVEIVHSGGAFVLPVDSAAEQDWLSAEINGFLDALRK